MNENRLSLHLVNDIFIKIVPLQASFNFVTKLKLALCPENCQIGLFFSLELQNGTDSFLNISYYKGIFRGSRVE